MEEHMSYYNWPSLSLSYVVMSFQGNPSVQIDASFYIYALMSDYLGNLPDFN